MPQQASRQSDNTSTLEINNPTAEITALNETSPSGGGKYNLRPNLNPNYS